MTCSNPVEVPRKPMQQSRNGTPEDAYRRGLEFTEPPVFPVPAGAIARCRTDAHDRSAEWYDGSVPDWEGTMRALLGYVCLGACLALACVHHPAAGRAASEPVSALDSRTACLFPDWVDVDSDEAFARLYDKDAKELRRQVLAKVRDQLQGKTEVRQRPVPRSAFGSPRDERWRVSLLDADSIDSEIPIRDLIDMWIPPRELPLPFEAKFPMTDGLAHLAVRDPERLARAMAGAGVKYLLILSPLHLSRGSVPCWVGLPAIAPGRYTGGFESTKPAACLGSRAALWQGESRSVVWESTIEGCQEITYRFTEGTIERAAEIYVSNLCWALTTP